MTAMPVTTRSGRMVNALSVDVEEYFQVSAFDTPAHRAQWDRLESRVCRSTTRLLDLFAAEGATATFFVLGWVAERHPALVRRIAAAGHDIASHGYAHELVYTLTPERFRADLRRARQAIGDACGIEVRAYRAPSFSITARSLWALDVLAEEGYTLDSSVFPVRRGRYGLPGAPRFTHTIDRPAGRLTEVPPSTIRLAGQSLPVAGGGYFRLYPTALTHWAIRRLNLVEGRPAVVYLHPWEVDPGQPRQNGSAMNRFRHSVNLGQTESRLTALLRQFSFASVATVAANEGAIVQAASGRETARRPVGSLASAATVRP